MRRGASLAAPLPVTAHGAPAVARRGNDREPGAAKGNASVVVEAHFVGPAMVLEGQHVFHEIRINTMGPLT